MAIKMSSLITSSLSLKTSLYPKTLSLSSSCNQTKPTPLSLTISSKSRDFVHTPKVILNNFHKPKVNNNKKKTEVYALGKYIPISAHKARRVIDQIRGRSYEDTVMILELMPYRACSSILKLVYSAAANASYIMGSKETDLIISKARVDQGTMVKKLRPRAKGRSFPIRRHTCHITIGVQDITLDESTYRTESDT